MRWVLYVIAAWAILRGIYALHEPHTPLVGAIGVLLIVLGLAVMIGTWAILRRR